MHPAAILQFERMLGEYDVWRAVPEAERSPAPAWWWGPAMALRTSSEPLPAGWRAALGLSGEATYADAVKVFLGTFAGQTAVSWPFDFPRKASLPDAATVRELQPQPSDDSAFQP
jgi:hypothetical protein